MPGATPAGLGQTLLISAGGGPAHPPEHEAGDQVAEQKGRAACEPLGSRKLVPGMASGNREPQGVLGELLHDHGGEQVSENTNHNRRGMRFRSESALDEGVACPATSCIATTPPLLTPLGRRCHMTDSMILLLF